mmetsp:Transcript_27028/g.65585  ORF Transcript_27028/g.65585 Transcript_27028/m.65585 type:complete len:88 (+) Transcript_27028:104-367(+)
MKPTQELVVSPRPTKLQTIHEALPTTTNDPPIIFVSNLKTQGRVMIYDEETFGFKMVHDDQLVGSPDESSHDYTACHDRQHPNVNNF